MNSPTHLLLVYLFSIIGLTVNSPPYRYASFVLGSGILAGLVNRGTSVEEHSTTIILTSLFFTMSGLLVCSNPHDLHMVGQMQPTDTLPVLTRIKRAVMLIVSPRLIGWTAEPTSVLPPRSRRTSRLSFAVEQLMCLIFNMLMLNVAIITMDRTPEFQSNGPRLSDAPWILRYIHTLQFALVSSSVLKMTHQASVLAFLATGRWSPSDFSPALGTWCDAYTVRKFWGRTWHQMVRHTLTTHARFMSQKVLKLPKHSRATKYAELYLVFFVSGLLHYTPECLTLRSWSSGALRFFTLQAAAVHFEHTIIAFASSKLGLKHNMVWQAVGYLWVLQWFTWSLPMWLEPQIRGGILEHGAKVRVIETVCSYVLDRCPLV